MNKYLLPLTAIALCFCATQAMAANSPATGDAKAKIIAPLTITQSENMNFGTMLSSSAHNVTLDHADGRTSTVNAMLVDDKANAPKSGKFVIKNGGTSAVTATISLPASTTVSANETSLTVDTFTSDFPTGSNNIPAGDTNLKVGATLHVTANAPAGDYTGQYTVTINY
ncbi:MAG: DUF4402 domain-containing protein [Rhodospirillales bacterium]|nr:DUF4402 domain-containing protein [Rhodospirillales bacterium]